MSNGCKRYDVSIYAVGIAHCSVCAPKGLGREEIERQVNELRPPGGSLRWRVSERPTFATGEPNPAACEHLGCNEHWLMEYGS